MVKCPDCGREISTLAAACPECGCPMKAPMKSEDERTAKLRRARERNELYESLFRLFIAVMVVLTVISILRDEKAMAWIKDFFTAPVGIKHDFSTGRGWG